MADDTQDTLHRARRPQEARRGAGFENASEAARAFRWNENTYRSHENGERGLRADVGLKYALAFKVSHAWLITGYGRGTLNNDINVYGLIKRNGLIHRDRTSEHLFSVSLPFIPPENARAYEIHTDHLRPKYRRGDLIISWPLVQWDKKDTLGPPPDLDVIVWKNKRGHLLESHWTFGRGDGDEFLMYTDISTARPAYFKETTDTVDVVGTIVPAGMYQDASHYISSEMLKREADDENDRD